MGQWWGASESAGPGALCVCVWGGGVGEGILRLCHSSNQAHTTTAHHPPAQPAHHLPPPPRLTC